MHPIKPPRRGAAQGGFTALELLTVVSILGVLMALAAPGFTPVIERWRVRQAAEALQGGLHLARSEALKRGGHIMLAPDTCSGGADCGWMVFHDKNGDGRHDAGQEDILRRIPATTRIDIHARPAAGVPFNRWGLPDAAAGAEFRVQPVGGNAANASLVCLKSGGLVRRLEQRGSTSPITCG